MDFLTLSYLMLCVSALLLSLGETLIVIMSLKGKKESPRKTPEELARKATVPCFPR